MGLRDRFKAAMAGFLGAGDTSVKIVAGATSQGSATKPRDQGQWAAAYNDSPWLRATVGKIAWSLAALHWGITRTMSPTTLRTIRRRDLQSAPFDVRQKTITSLQEQGHAEVIYEHPLLTAIADPCPMFVGTQARMLRAIYFELHGEFFELIERGGPAPMQQRFLDLGSLGGGPGPVGSSPDATPKAIPTGFWPIPPHWIKRTPTPDKPTFDIEYGNVQMRGVPMSEILWQRNPDTSNPYGRGIGTIPSLARELDADENASRMINYRFYNQGRPDLLIGLPDWDLKSVKAFQQDWQATLGGVQNAGKTHFVNTDPKAQKLGDTFESLRVIDLRRFERDMVREVLGIPPEVLGILEHSNRATSDAAEYLYGRYVVIPRAEVWREFYQKHLVPEYDDRAIIDYVSPLQEDKNYSLNVARVVPWVLKVNDWRKLAALNPLTPEEGGECFLVPQGYTAVESLSEAVAPGVSPAQPPGMGHPEAAGAGVSLDIPGSAPAFGPRGSDATQSHSTVGHALPTATGQTDQRFTLDLPKAPRRPALAVAAAYSRESAARRQTRHSPSPGGTTEA